MLKGQLHTKETRQKMSKSHLGKKHNHKTSNGGGLKLSAKTKKQLSILKIGDKNPNFGRKMSQEAIEKMKKRIVSDETRKKMSLAMSGSNSHRWIKDRSLLKAGKDRPYNTLYKYWMLAVKKRDSWKCRIGNCDCGGRLEAHHILPWRDYPELRYDINNGISLCVKHHPRKKKEEARLSPFFRSLLVV
jgi:hypothetical protein